MGIIEADFRPHVVIVTKRRVYDLGPNAMGQPLEDVFGQAVPASLPPRSRGEDAPAD